MGARTAPRAPWLGALLLASYAACGGRTGLNVPPPEPEPPECAWDGDCVARQANRCLPVECVEQRCVEGETPRDCDDHDPCTQDTCVPETGACAYTIAAFDHDGDGFRGPVPGKRAGEPGSCGDDCDDSSAAAYPGGVEVCDGVDNDCNGIVDDNASFLPKADEAVRVSGDIAPAGPGGLAFGGKTYAAVYSGATDGFDVYVSMLDPNGSKIVPPGEQQLTLIHADGGGGPVVWIGDRYGVAWQERRSGDYEIFFTLLDEQGKKVIPDTQLSFAQGFSLYPTLGFNGAEFLVVWQDERSGSFHLYGQRLSVDGVPLGGNVKITDTSSFVHEAPVLAVGVKGVGLAWQAGTDFSNDIRFQVLNPDLTPAGKSVQLTGGTTEAVYPVITFNDDRYAVAWFDRAASPKAIYGASLDETGVVLTPAKALTSPGDRRSRYPSLLGLGDRMILVYADDRDQNDGYELYTRMLGLDLSPQSPEHRFTFAPRDSVYPVAAFGPDGDVGVLFRDDRDAGGEHHVFFTALGCSTAP